MSTIKTTLSMIWAEFIDYLQHYTANQFMLMICGIMLMIFGFWFVFYCKSEKSIGAAALSFFIGVVTVQGVLDSTDQAMKERERESRRIETIEHYEKTGELKDE